MDLACKKECPGPGSYNPKNYNIASTGSYTLSNVKYLFIFLKCRNQISPRIFTAGTYSLDKIKTKRSIT